jgi:ribosome-associated protein
MTSETQPRKTDVQKLQRAIVDGLEDVKGQDIVVFNTEHLSPLFERVIIASGTSNRQTKALASSVSDAVREAGFPKPRVEGEENGEWIIVDCGAAVAHVMQPTIRAYYHLEEIWGGKTVRLTIATAKKAEAVAASKAAAPKSPARKKAAVATEATVATPAKASPARKEAA